MSNLQIPNFARWGDGKPDQVVVGVHGFAGSGLDFEKLGLSLAKKNSGLQVISYDRGRNPELTPPKFAGTGGIQANATELLIALGEAAQQDINEISLAGHSLGGPIISAAVQMVLDGNLHPNLAAEEPRLEQIVAGIGAINLIAPAGFTNAYALTPLAGFAGHSLAKAIFNGARGIIGDAQGLSGIWQQRQRAISAGRYLGRFKFSLEECIDACGPETMSTFANNPELAKRTAIIAYDEDEIFSTDQIQRTLANPDIRGTDFAIYEALKKLNPREAILLMQHLSLAGAAGFMALRALVSFKDADQNQDPFNESQEKVLKSIRVIGLKGNHTTPLTEPGAEELANHLSSAALNKAYSAK